MAVPVLLRKLPILKTVVGDPASTTEVTLINEILDRFIFMPWVDFHDQAEALAKRISNLSPADYIAEAEHFLKSLDLIAEPCLVTPAVLQIAKELEIFAEGVIVGAEGESTIPVFENEQAMAKMFQNVLNVVEPFIRLFTGSTKYQFKQGRMKSQIQILSEAKVLCDQELRIMRRLRGQSAAGGPQQALLPITEQERLELQKNLDTMKLVNAYFQPDYNLAKVDGYGQRNEQPICCIELKSPQKNITGRRDEPTRGTPNEPRTEEEMIDVPHGQNPDNAISIARRLNRIMTTDSTETDGNLYSASARKAIAQALSYALETKSGMTYLWNWGDGVVFRVERTGKGRGVCYVAVVNERSNPLVEGHQVGHVASILHFSLTALKRAISSHIEEDLDHFRGEISNAIAEGSDSYYLRLKQGSGPKNSYPEVVLRGQGGNTESGDGSSSPTAITSPCPPYIPSLSFGTQENAVRTLNRGKMHTANLYPTLDEVSSFLKSISTERIASGMSGNIFKGDWCAKPVFVKLWNGDSDYGHFSMKQEVLGYWFLSERAPEVLGTAVPKPRMCWIFKGAPRHMEGVGLVTDLTGCGIRYAANGELEVEENGTFMELSRSELHGVCEAAVKSLTDLHSSGLLHGDVELRNLRVERNAKGNYGWRAWWVDLGESREINSRNFKLTLMEIADCKRAFQLPPLSDQLTPWYGENFYLDFDN